MQTLQNSGEDLMFEMHGSVTWEERERAAGGNFLGANDQDLHVNVF